jgi:hypothetical protein
MSSATEPTTPTVDTRPCEVFVISHSLLIY